MQYLSEKELREQNEKLSEELKLCKADKEFVWSLWKELQSQSPDLTGAVDLIIAREKLKNRQRLEEMDANLLVQKEEIGRLKTDELDVEKKENARKADALCKTALECEVVREKCAQLQEENKTLHDTERGLRIQLNEATNDAREKHMLEAAYQCQVEKVQALEEELSNVGNKMAGLSKECSSYVEKCQRLEQQLKECQGELQATREATSSKEADIALLREDLFKCQESHTKEVAAHTNACSKLEARITELETEITELKNDLNAKDRRIQSQTETINELVPQLENLRREKISQPDRSGEETAMNQPDIASKSFARQSTKGKNAFRHRGTKRARCRSTSTPMSFEKQCEKDRLLEATEKELFDTKMQLRLKGEELECLRKVHDQRQRRIRVLLKEHKLVLKQLKTFMDQDENPKEKVWPKRLNSPTPLVPTPSLNSEVVLSELKIWKTKCKELEKKLLSLEEERDTLSAQCIHTRTRFSELQCLFQNTKEELERSAANVEFQIRNQLLEKKLSELQKEKDFLQDQVTQLHQQKSLVTLQLHREKESLSAMLSQLEEEKTSLTTTVSQMEYKKECGRRELIDLQKDKSSLEAMVHQEREAHEKVLHQLHHEKALMDGMVSQLRHDKGRLEVKINRLQYEKGVLIARCSAYKDKCHRTREEMAKLQLALTELRHKSTNQSVTDSDSQVTGAPETDQAMAVSPHLSISSLHEDHGATETPVSDSLHAAPDHSATETPVSDCGSSHQFKHGSSRHHYRAHSDGEIMLTSLPKGNPHPLVTQTGRTLCVHVPTTASPETTPTKASHQDSCPVHATSVIRSSCSLRKGTAAKNGPPTKHLSNQQLRSLQCRLKTLSDHVTVLNNVKQSLSQALDAERANSEKSKVEIKELSQKLRASKAALQSVQGELHTVTDAKAEIEHKYNDLVSQKSKDVSSRSEAEWKQIEEDKKNLQEKCSGLTEASKRLEADLKRVKEEAEFAQNRCIKMDRDLKQKKQLINDLRSKLDQMKETASNDQQKMQSLNNEVLSLNSSLNKSKHQTELLRSQLKQQVNENEKLAQALKECQQDVTRTLNQLNSCQEEQEKKLRMLTQREAELNKKSEACHEMESKLISKERVMLHNFQAFTKMLADELCKESAHRVSLKRMTQDGSAEASGEQISERVRGIAYAFLNFSEGDLDEFLSEAKDNLPSAYLEPESLLKFKEAVRKFQYESTVATDMVHLFLQFIRENL